MPNLKRIFLVSLIYSSLILFGQEKGTDCYEFMHYEQNRSFCDTTYLTNGAKLYYKWNCDSTWLTFEFIERTILKSCMNTDPIICSRTGISFIKEYPSYLLFINKYSSSSSWSLGLTFLNKQSGQEIFEISNKQFVWGNSDEDYALYFSNTKYDELIYLDCLSNKKHKYFFKENKVNNSISNNGEIELNKLFENFNKNSDSFEFDFRNEDDEIEHIKIEIN